MPVPAPSPELVPLSPAPAEHRRSTGHRIGSARPQPIVPARREDLLNILPQADREKYGVTVEVRPTDLADTTERAKLADELATETISILCANAGSATFGRSPLWTPRRSGLRFS